MDMVERSILLVSFFDESYLFGVPLFFKFIMCVCVCNFVGDWCIWLFITDEELF